jgi:hypothetical protein
MAKLWQGREVKVGTVLFVDGYIDFVSAFAQAVLSRGVRCV